jgi:hypothetical protein
MEIKLAENSMWGGIIPDVIRNNRISLKFGNDLRLDFSGEEFEYLKSFLDQETQNWLKICQKIVKQSDEKDDIMRKYYHKLDDATDEKKDIYDLRLILADFYNEYWGV